MSYIKGSNVNVGKNPFDEIEDVDDNTFLNHPRQGHSGYVLNNETNNPTNQSWENKRQQLLDERRRIEDQTLQSTRTTLGLIYETEKVGVQTAEELIHQREQLENVNDKLDSINSIMRVSQKHLTSMKSVFGGFKNYFLNKGSNDSNAANNGSKQRLSSSASESRLSSTVETLKNNELSSQSTHPALRRKDIDSNGFYDEKSPTKSGQETKNSLSAYDLHSREVDRQLDQNLEEMGMGISRLKDLALGLGNEIDSQNTLLDGLATKSDRAQDTIANQNRQMKRILKS